MNTPEQLITAHVRAIEAALALAGAAMPDATSRALAAIEELNAAEIEPLDPGQLIHELLTARTPADRRKVLDAAIAATDRHGSLHTVRNAISAGMWAETGAIVLADLGEVAAKLEPAFTTATAKLAEAAGNLPGKDPLADHEAILKTGRGAAWIGATEALDPLRVMAQALNPGDLHTHLGNAPRSLAAIVPVLDIPTITEPTPAPRGMGISLSAASITAAGPEGARSVRTVAKSMTDHGLDATLIRVARGDWKDLTLSLPSSAGELYQRCASADLAHTAQMVADDRSPRAVVR